MRPFIADWDAGTAHGRAVADSGGSLVSFKRMAGAQLASVEIAIHKARASAKFRRETKAFEAGVQNGLNYLVTIDDSSPTVAVLRWSRVARSSGPSAAQAARARRTRWSPKRALQPSSRLLNHGPMRGLVKQIHAFPHPRLNQLFHGFLELGPNRCCCWGKPLGHNRVQKVLPLHAGI